MSAGHVINNFAANIPKYFIYTLLKGLNFGLVSAIWVIFLQQQHGLGLTAITLIDLAPWLAAAFGEIPTGIVADAYGRKPSLIIGALIMCLSMFGWAIAPTVALVALAYGTLAFGTTFLSGAEDALLFESLRADNRASDYGAIVGRMSASRLAAVVVGNLFSGILASVDLRLPFISGGISLLAMLFIVLTIREPNAHSADQSARIGYGQILRQAASILRTRPTLRYAIAYLTIVPLAAVVLETVFLQPQAVALGVPIAAVGVVVMAAQFSNMSGSALAHRIKRNLGEAQVIYLAPFAIAVSLVLLGIFQTLPGLLFAATISFSTAVIRPIALAWIQNEVEDNIRATVLSVQALIFSFVAAIIEPLLGLVAERTALPVAYYALAGGGMLVILLLFWRGRGRFPAKSG